jgi:hypothetical protein
MSLRVVAYDGTMFQAVDGVRVRPPEVIEPVPAVSSPATEGDNDELEQ